MLCPAIKRITRAREGIRRQILRCAVREGHIVHVARTAVRVEHNGVGIFRPDGIERVDILFRRHPVREQLYGNARAAVIENALPACRRGPAEEGIALARLERFGIGKHEVPAVRSRDGGRNLVHKVAVSCVEFKRISSFLPNGIERNGFILYLICQALIDRNRAAVLDLGRIDAIRIRPTEELIAELYETVCRQGRLAIVQYGLVIHRARCRRSAVKLHSVRIRHADRRYRNVVRHVHGRDDDCAARSDSHAISLLADGHSDRCGERIAVLCFQREAIALPERCLGIAICFFNPATQLKRYGDGVRLPYGIERDFPAVFRREIGNFRFIVVVGCRRPRLQRPACERVTRASEGVFRQLLRHAVREGHIVHCALAAVCVKRNGVGVRRPHGIERDCAAVYFGQVADACAVRILVFRCALFRCPASKRITRARKGICRQVLRRAVCEGHVAHAARTAVCVEVYGIGIRAPYGVQRDIAAVCRRQVDDACAVRKLDFRCLRISCPACKRIARTLKVVLRQILRRAVCEALRGRFPVANVFIKRNGVGICLPYGVQRDVARDRIVVQRGRGVPIGIPADKLIAVPLRLVGYNSAQLTAVRNIFLHNVARSAVCVKRNGVGVLLRARRNGNFSRDGRLNGNHAVVVGKIHRLRADHRNGNLFGQMVADFRAETNYNLFLPVENVLNIRGDPVAAHRNGVCVRLILRDERNIAHAVRRDFVDRVTRRRIHPIQECVPRGRVRRFFKLNGLFNRIRRRVRIPAAAVQVVDNIVLDCSPMRGQRKGEYAVLLLNSVFRGKNVVFPLLIADIPAVESITGLCRNRQLCKDRIIIAAKVSFRAAAAL